MAVVFAPSIEMAMAENSRFASRSRTSVENVPAQYNRLRRWPSDAVICDRLRTLREEKKPSQGDVEKDTGLLRCYISCVENGHTVPTVETLPSCTLLSWSSSIFVAGFV
jgi:hypothetical protein